MDDARLAKAVPPSGDSGKEENSFPFIFGLADAFITNCSDRDGNFHVMSPGENSFLTPSTENPVQTILTIMNKGLRLPTTFYPRRIALVVEVGDSGLASCTWSRNTTAKYSFQNQAGEYVPKLTATPGPPPACTAKNAAELDSLIKEIYDVALNFNDTRQIGQIQLLFSVLQTGEAWIGCEAYTKELLQFTNINIT
jgi:hypothetical protein